MPNLFDPFQLGAISVKNRIMMPALLLDTPNENGMATRDHVDFYKRRAIGGAGVIVVGACYVNGQGRQGPCQLGIDQDEHIPGLADITRAIRAEGCVALAQLNHAGRYASSAVTGQQPVAPSAVFSRYSRETPRELSYAEVEKVQSDFINAAVRAKKAGFEGVELLAATGYLISEFLSPVTNLRSDRFGGDLRSRLTFLLEVIAGIKQAAGPDFVLCCRISYADRVPGGNTFEDTRIIAAALQEAGVNALSMTAGWHDSADTQITSEVQQGAYTQYPAEIKKTSTIPIGAAVRIVSPAVAENIIAEGLADFIVLGRALIADPDWPVKLQSGRRDNIRLCIACCHCFDRAFAHQPVECTINPEVGADMQLPAKCPAPKHALVLGGGPAGMQAAITMAARGHNVTLLERKEQLGGRLPAASVPPFKGELANLVGYFEEELSRMAVDVRLGVSEPVTAAKELAPDEIVLATGADPIVPPEFQAFLGKGVSVAEEVLLRDRHEGQEFVVIGGGLVGCEVADYLSEKGKTVTIIEILSKIGTGIGGTNRWGVMRRLKNKGVRQFVNARVTSIDGNAVIFSVADGQQELLPADEVVLALGYRPSRDLEESLGKICGNVHLIGSCHQTGKIIDAIREGYRLGCRI